MKNNDPEVLNSVIGFIGVVIFTICISAILVMCSP
jgi:uncharacterized membrane protein